MDIRTKNNKIKMDWMNQHVPYGSMVLDIGCGQGGDVHKWKKLGAHVLGVDPNYLAIEEAKKRSPGSTFIHGTIRDVPLEMKFDLVCYNFSLHYEDPKNYSLISSFAPKVVGIVSNPDSILTNRDDTRICVQRVSPTHVSVYIPDVPYYRNGPVVEPLFNRVEFEKYFDIVEWEEFSIYAKFVGLKK